MIDLKINRNHLHPSTHVYAKFDKPGSILCRYHPDKVRSTDRPTNRPTFAKQYTPTSLKGGIMNITHFITVLYPGKIKNKTLSYIPLCTMLRLVCTPHINSSSNIAIFFFYSIGKHCGERRKCWYLAFIPFSTFFFKGFFHRVIKKGLWKSKKCFVKNTDYQYFLDYQLFLLSLHYFQKNLLRVMKCISHENA